MLMPLSTPPRISCIQTLISVAFVSVNVTVTFTVTVTVTVTFTAIELYVCDYRLRWTFLLTAAPRLHRHRVPL